MCYVLCVVYEIRLCHRLQLGVKLPCLLMTGPVSPHRHHLYLYNECSNDNGDFSDNILHNDVINTIISGHY